MSKTFSNVLAVPIFRIALFIVHKTGALTKSRWISVACIARQSNRQPHNTMLFNVVNAICRWSGGYLTVETALFAAIVFGAIYVENSLGKLHTFAISFIFFCNLF